MDQLWVEGVCSMPKNAVSNDMIDIEINWHHFQLNNFTINFNESNKFDIYLNQTLTTKLSNKIITT